MLHYLHCNMFYCASSFRLRFGSSELPGFDGELPCYLETGYIGVGESNKSQLFYYFVESQRSPAHDPLMLWLTGGPGPVAFDYGFYNGSLPSLHLTPYTWTKGLNIIYVDAPVGTGFSYSTTQENYYVNDTKSAAQTCEFLRKWLIEHPQFLNNQLFIGGDSYSGFPPPMIVQHVLDGNQIGLEPTMTLKNSKMGVHSGLNLLKSYDMTRIIIVCYLGYGLMTEQLEMLFKLERTEHECGRGAMAP
ncbi:hypothetical protein Dsin_008313 [Dipteronia sinensis]|uniref:Uncharacterized protein n=1 Tax=Dipteronia sinensis TaxID=43782 RepID=A0AAE0EAK0_9ROSI|nr:hypothetical protein Dsin_008313 [Dipteronia sinensis]